MEKHIQRKRAKKMLPNIKILINIRAIQESERKRAALANELIRDIRRNFPKEKPPVKETVMKLISRARNSSRGLDKPWDLSTLDDNPISSKAIAQIFELRIKGLSKFTIRDAEWLDRLSSIPLHVEILCRLAQLLSLNEKYSEITKDPFYTNYWEKEILRYLENPADREWALKSWSFSEGLDVNALFNMFSKGLKEIAKGGTQ